MVKALLNSINNIPNTTAQLNSAASDNVSKTDFEKLFDKQQSLASNDKRPEDNTKDDDEESSEKAVSPNDTFAGSVAYDIRQLIAFLKSAGMIHLQIQKKQRYRILMEQKPWMQMK